MLYTLILLQFSAHLLADFVFQSQKWSDRKKEKSFTWQHIYHALIVFILAWLFSLDFNFWIAAAVITIVHFLADVLKSRLQIKHEQKGTGRNYFFTDQLIHLVTLVIVVILYDHLGKIDFVFDINLKIAAILAGFILCAKPANIIIKNIFEAFSIHIPEDEEKEKPDSEVVEEKSLPNAGKVIGVAERFLALGLILVGQYSAVGLIIAAKSILRFNDTQKNEYILVGTLLSFGIAGITGILIKTLVL